MGGEEGAASIAKDHVHVRHTVWTLNFGSVSYFWNSQVPSLADLVGFCNSSIFQSSWLAACFETR